MTKAKRTSVIAVLLCLAMVFTLALGVLPNEAHAVTQAEIDALQAQKDALTSRREEKQALVDELESQHATILEQKLAMDARNEYTQQQIDLTNEQIDLYDQMIEEKKLELDAAKKREAEQLERYRNRVCAMEEDGGLNYLALILRANSFGQLLTLMDDIGEIMESDRNLEDAYIAAREETEQVKAEYEQTKTELEEKKADLRAEQEQLQKQIDEANELIASIESDMENRREEYEQLRNAENEASAEIEKMIAELERQKEEERRQWEAANGGNNGGGGGGGSSGGGNGYATGTWGWPCPSCYYITSRVGNRWHPVSGQWKYHSGLDIGAQYGASIVASDGGTVSLAGVNGGYGNCVMIDHGNGYYTLYGHMSSIAVSYGQVVSKGDVVGYVGSTGVSTGPHLHFEIREGGVCIDPEMYFGGLSYAPDAGD